MADIMNDRLQHAINAVNAIPNHALTLLIEYKDNRDAVGEICAQYIDAPVGNLITIFFESLPPKEHRLLTARQVARYANEVLSRINVDRLPLVVDDFLTCVDDEIASFIDPGPNEPGPAHYNIVPGVGIIEDGSDARLGTSDQERSSSSSHLQPGWIQGVSPLGLDASSNSSFSFGSQPGFSFGSNPDSSFGPPSSGTGFPNY